MHLKGSSCYLVGAIEHDPQFGSSWRDLISSKLSNIGVKIYNPLNRPRWMQCLSGFVPPVVSRQKILENIKGSSESEWSKAQTAIRKICLRYVNTCDFVVCYLNEGKTYGTIEELSVANKAGKPIIFIIPESMPSLWVYDYTIGNPVFNDVNGAINFLYEVNKGEIELDALKWIFIGDGYDRKTFGIDNI